ncbi:MAG: hypothetical protein QOI98_2101 [Solirubrobacteraceae bacterium]|nr:hypothetical protein [Solirubrobacteraceae bacterium]
MGMTVDEQAHAAVMWHDVECGSYAADLPTWHELAAGASGQVLDLGAGTGRVALSLARLGHEVVALDRDAALLAALRERAAGLALTTVEADARDFDLGRLFALCICPMQTIQIVGGADDRMRLLACVRRHLAEGGVMAAAIATDLEPFEEASAPPLPDMREDGDVVFASRPIALRVQAGEIVIERIRETVAPDGQRTEQSDTVRLARLSPRDLEREMRSAGFETLPVRRILPTSEHVGSWVVMASA